MLADPKGRPRRLSQVLLGGCNPFWTVKVTPVTTEDNTEAAGPKPGTAVLERKTGHDDVWPKIWGKQENRETNSFSFLFFIFVLPWRDL